MINWIDVHTHLNMLDVSPDEALKAAQSQGVERVITIGTNPEDWPTVLELAKKYAPKVFCTLGLHPHDAEKWNEEHKKFLLAHLNDTGVLAVGEIGLDYYYKNASVEAQHKAFREQLEIAAVSGLPVEIHTRDADTDTMDFLKEFRGRVRGLLHCFTSSWELAEVALQCDFDISFSGVITFKNAESIREVCRRVPLERLHVETDAPFLAPVPQRGKKNRPDYVVHTAEFVAQLKGVSLQELSQHTLSNAKKLFARL